MIDKFHCDKGGEPRRSGLREEFVMVGCYVEGTDLVGKISLEDGGEKGDCVDHWIGALVLFQCTDMYVEKPSLGGGEEIYGK